MKKEFNILIIDDVENNVNLLKYLIDDFLKEFTEYTFKIFEGFNGKEAVEMTKKQKIDILFIDVLMPEMDGIEATKIIREKNKNILIVAVSTSDDLSYQQKILEVGAEDYILKPVNVDIFKARFKNYLNLSFGRNKALENHGKITPFPDHILYRKTSYFLESDVALNEFWEYYQLKKHSSELRNLTEVVRVLFSLASLQVENDIYSEVYIERSVDCKFFTLVNIDKCDRAKVKNILEKNKTDVPYILIDDRISYKFSGKAIRGDNPAEKSTMEIFDEEIEKQLLENELLAADFMDAESLEILDSYLALVEQSESQELSPHLKNLLEKAKKEETDQTSNSEIDLENLKNIQELGNKEDELEAEAENSSGKVLLENVEQDDIDILEDSFETLTNTFIFIDENSVSRDEVRKIIITLESIKRVLTGYSETFILAQMLGEVGRYLLTNSNNFTNSETNGVLISHFQKLSEVLSVWFRMLFIDGAPLIGFMDDRINSIMQKILDELKK